MKIRHLKITFEKRRKLNLLLALPTPLLVTQFKIKILMLSICEPCISFGWKPTPIPGFPGCMALVVASLSAFVRASCCSWQSPGRILSRSDCCWKLSPVWADLGCNQHPFWNFFLSPFLRLSQSLSSLEIRKVISCDA